MLRPALALLRCGVAACVWVRRIGRDGHAVAAVGLDETAFARANPIRSRVSATGIVDLQRAKLIEIVEGRSRKVLANWLSGQAVEWTAGVEARSVGSHPGIRVGRDNWPAGGGAGA